MLGGQRADFAGADDEHARALSRRPKILRASATAAKLTETAPSPSAVSVRTRLPTPNDQWKSLLSTGPTHWRSRGRLERVLDLAENLRLARPPANRGRRRRGTGAATASSS